MLGAGLVLLLLPLSQGHTWGWVTPATLGCLGAAAVVLTGWVFLLRRREHPLVRPGLLADRRMLVPNVAGLMTGFGLFASFLAVTQFVQVPTAAGYGFGAGTLEAAVNGCTTTPTSLPVRARVSASSVRAMACPAVAVAPSRPDPAGMAVAGSNATVEPGASSNDPSAATA